MNQVQIIADSVSPQGHRITTFICDFWRALLAEVNTHRMLSRNSASSRAIPFQKMLQKVLTNPFIPMKWMKEHTGMQGTEYFTEPNVIGTLEEGWLAARDNAVEMANGLAMNGLSKQICNRLLEPFLHHTALITGTEFENFFALRAHPQAEIHFADLAQKMLDTYNASEPKQLKAGEWHMPFGDQVDEDRILETLGDVHNPGPQGWFDSMKLKIATARCARISYGTFEGKDDYEADIKLHDRLLASGHLSPFEHCARAMSDTEYYRIWSHTTDKGNETGWCGNFRGFLQYRKLFSNENLKDPRVKHYDVK